MLYDAAEEIHGGLDDPIGIGFPTEFEVEGDDGADTFGLLAFAHNARDGDDNIEDVGAWAAASSIRTLMKWLAPLWGDGYEIAEIIPASERSEWELYGEQTGTAAKASQASMMEAFVAALGKGMYKTVVSMGEWPAKAVLEAMGLAFPGTAADVSDELLNVMQTVAECRGMAKPTSFMLSADKGGGFTVFGGGEAVLLSVAHAGQPSMGAAKFGTLCATCTLATLAVSLLIFVARNWAKRGDEPFMLAALGAMGDEADLAGETKKEQDERLLPSRRRGGESFSVACFHAHAHVHAHAHADSLSLSLCAPLLATAAPATRNC
jgi:hypothetical protein